MRPTQSYVAGAPHNNCARRLLGRWPRPATSPIRVQSDVIGRISHVGFFKTDLTLPALVALTAML